VKLSENSATLAEAADLLHGSTAEYLRQLAELIKPVVTRLEKGFFRRLQNLSLDARQKKALAAITPFAASHLLIGQQPLSAFLEQVEYNGRRLAKLKLSPATVVRLLRESYRLPAWLCRQLSETKSSQVAKVLEQLYFCVVITLNKAFYQVREVEVRTYEELFQAELSCKSLDSLLTAMLEILSRYCQADCAVIFLLEPDCSRWQSKAAFSCGKPCNRNIEVPNRPALQRKLAKPSWTVNRQASQRLALDPNWPAEFESCWSIPLPEVGQTCGVVQFAFRRSYACLPRELELLTAAAERCSLAAAKAILMEELAIREKQVRQLASHMMEIEERERRRISTELHDEAGQSLLCVRLQLEMLERATEAISGALRGKLAEIRSLVEKSIVEIRRLVGDLSPAVLEQLGLSAALRQLAARLRSLRNVRVHLHTSSLQVAPKDLAHVVYRLTQECVNNIVKHSAATNVKISVSCDDFKLKLQVEDDGVGFDVQEVLRRLDSHGLAGMRERVALFGGEFYLDSRPGAGTKVLINLPIPAEKP
jgi:signal transduction histidine kinase